MSEPERPRLLERTVLARAGARALLGVALGVLPGGAPGALALGLACGATALVERAVVLRARRRPGALRAALEATFAVGLLLALALLHLAVLGGALGPADQTEALQRWLDGLRSVSPRVLVAAALGIGALVTFLGAPSGAIALEALDEGPLPVWPADWLLAPSLLVGLLAGLAVHVVTASKAMDGVDGTGVGVAALIVTYVLSNVGGILVHWLDLIASSLADVALGAPPVAARA